MSEAAPNKRGRRGSGQEHDASSMNQQVGNDASVNQQILEVLQMQNNSLQTQNTLLQSIDAKLGREERQHQGNNRMHRGGQARLPNESIQEGSWKFVESP